MSRARRSLGLIGAALLAGAPLARAEEPLSAIDWLSQSVATAPVLGTLPPPVPGPSATPPATPATPAPISVAPIDGTSLDALGLLSASVSGLPRGLWGTTSTAELARLLRAERLDTLPAVQRLIYTLLLAELDPPTDADGQNLLFLARIDKLLDLGALEPALEMLELIPKPGPEPFRRWFDAALLLGEEDRACLVMRESPHLAPTFPARVFCLARGGDWNAAALTLRLGETLGHIDPDMAELLARFLDPELSEEAEDLPLPARPSPLVLRLMEAVGQPLPTGSLPLAFAQSDLRSNSGWKTRIEAAERLARSGAIEPNQLLALYTERRRAASGGVWDRVEAVQRLETALADGNLEAVAQVLPPLWQMIGAAELEVPFASLFGARLAALGLPGEAGKTAFRIGLLSEEYERVARARTPADGIEAFLIGLAQGDVSRLAAPDQTAEAVKRAFDPAARPGPDGAEMLAEGRLGEALLLAIAKITDGAKGDLRDVTEGLTLLRATGMESTARRTALELLLLERRG